MNRPNVNLYFNYYQNPKRQHEIDECLRMNRLVFDKVFIVEGRPTFSELFAMSREYPNDINCFCNSDIYFTDLSHVRKINENECFAITRNDMLKTIYRDGSQDAWVFKGAIKPIQADFTMGLWGCDNRIAYEIKKAGYDIKNPSLSINIVHLHAVDERNHKRTELNTVPPPYLTIKPIAI